MGRGERGHDSDGRFAGSNRVNVEDVPRLPTFPAAWTLADPRGRPYFVFWTSPHDDTLTRVLRMESVQQGAAVQLTIPDVGVFQIPIVRRQLPRRRGSSILYRCPGCGQPRRHLYLRSLVIGRLVDYQGPLCQACAGLRWASQGRYIWALAPRTVFRCPAGAGPARRPRGAQGAGPRRSRLLGGRHELRPLPSARDDARARAAGGQPVAGSRLLTSEG